MPGQSLQSQYDNYLMHHGVPGMKWGVRRQIRRNQKAAKRGSKEFLKRANYEYAARDMMLNSAKESEAAGHHREAKHYNAVAETHRKRGENYLKGSKDLLKLPLDKMKDGDLDKYAQSVIDRDNRIVDEYSKKNQ